jgi:membrane-associated protease RseP (regulator of RpoE activity)
MAISGLVFAVLAMASVVVASEAARTVLARALRLRLVRPRIGFAPIPDGPIAKQLGVIAAGPVGAYVAIAVIAFAHYRCNTFSAPARNLVYWVSTDYDAAGKLAPGDRIVEVDGQPFSDGGVAELGQRVNARHGAPIAIVVERDGARRAFEVQPRRADDVAGTKWRLGVTLAREDVHFDTASALAAASTYPWVQSATIVRGWIREFAPDDDGDPGGPVRIVEEFRFAKPFWVAALELALVFATYVLVVIALLDLVRASLAVIATIRRARSRAAATSDR